MRKEHSWHRTISLWRYFTPTTSLFSRANRGLQWETASLILCLCWACANAWETAEQIEVGGHFVSLSRKIYLVLMQESGHILT